MAVDALDDSENYNEPNTLSNEQGNGKIISIMIDIVVQRRARTLESKANVRANNALSLFVFISQTIEKKYFVCGKVPLAGSSCLTGASSCLSKQKQIDVLAIKPLARLRSPLRICAK